MDRLAHISDLHFGNANDRLVGALVDDLLAFLPDVLVVSGDLTQHARRRELEAARAFLAALPFPHVIVPGSHDVAPLTAPLERALRPWARFNSIAGESAATVHLPGGTAVIGVNTVAPWSLLEGGVSRAELARVVLEAGHPALFRVLAGHHPLLGSAGRGRGQRALLHTLETAKIDLVLTGHLHESFSGPAAARVGARHAVLTVQASTATSARLRGHTNAWNGISIDASLSTVRIDVRTATDGPFTAAGFALWQRIEGAWQPLEYERAGANALHV